MTKAFELLSLLVSARRFQQLVLTTPATNRFAPVGWINFFWQYSQDDFSIGSRPQACGYRAGLLVVEG